MGSAFSVSGAIEVLERTPNVVRALVDRLSDDWTATAANVDEWQPFDVVGHLIHADETDWIPRSRIILEQGENRTFVPFDRFAQFENSKGKSLADLLDEFEKIRGDSLETLRSWALTDAEHDLKGMHPELGEVTLRQLLSTWVVHDLNHIRQIVTAMAKRYDADVGVWKEYLSILK